MALALHRLTRLPLVKIVGLKRNLDPMREEGDDWCEETVHLAVGTSKLWIDVDGLHRKIPKERLLFSLFRPEKVAIRPSSVEEVTYLYTMSGVPEREIQAARRDALKDAVLGPIIHDLRKPPRRP